LHVPSSGKLLSGGVDPAALTFPKKFFGAARKIREGGSLTIIATALVDTGSKMDEVIFEEFKGTGNMELILSREIANDRIFPALNIKQSGTRKEELLIEDDKLKNIFVLRKIISDLGNKDALEFVLNIFKKHKTNEKMFKAIEKQKI
jgi:transcription termination factor Rho